MAASPGPLTPDEPPGPASPRWPCTATAVFPMAVLTLPNRPFRPVPTALPLWAPGPFGEPDRSAEGYVPRGGGEKDGQGQELGRGGLLRAYLGLREGDLRPLHRHARCAPRVRRGKTLEAFGGLQGLLDSARNPGEVIAGGAPEGPVRPYPVQALASGEILSLRSPLRPRNRGKKTVPTGTPAPTPLGSRSLPSSPRGGPPL